MKHNIVIGTPLCDPSLLISSTKEEWESSDRADTLFTKNRFLPAVLKEAGVVPSASEVRRNRPDLVVSLTDLDCFWVKWGKQRIYIVVGE